ncbi:MAG: hypothetical protein P4M07_04500 [Xanthobacteraceae bacterium]|nr:hypothetical protein [Xanthobacteraceae bacterium]
MLREIFSKVARYVAAHWLRAAVVIVALSAVFVLSQHAQKTGDPSGDEVATAWNQSISRLGILPIYPPAEDVSVGDVWAVIADVAEGDQTPLLGKAVRLDHIDLHKQIVSAARQPTFAETNVSETKASYMVQGRFEAEADPKQGNRIALNLTAFPGITINHAVDAGASAASGVWGWFGAERRRTSREEIRLKGTETYGMEPVDAIFILNDWCSADATKLLCSDERVRTILSFAVGDRVLATRDKRYTTTLAVQLVTRVYLARRIEQRRLDESAKSGAAQVGVVPSSTPADHSAPAVGRQGDDGDRTAALLAESVAKNLAASAGAGAKVSLARSDGVDLSLDETFQRPIVFGYRAVTIRLDPATPSEVAPP